MLSSRKMGGRDRLPRPSVEQDLHEADEDQLSLDQQTEEQVWGGEGADRSRYGEERVLTGAGHREGC